MIELVGDYWSFVRGEAWDAIVCTTNTTLLADNRLVMGAGIAKDFADRFNVQREWGDRVAESTYGGVMATQVDTQTYMGYLIAFPTKTDWRKPSPTSLIEKSAKQLSLLANMMGWDRILMTRPGCGHGGLKWEQVKPMLETVPFFDDRFYVVSKD